MNIIKNYKELDFWLSQNDYFEEGYILKIDSDPLVITIGYLLEGNYKANSKKIVCSFEITPKNVYEWSCSLNEFNTSEEHYIEYVEPVKVDKGIGLNCPLSPSFQLIAESFQISDPKLIESFFKPWLSNREFSFEVNLDHVIEPFFWIE